MAMCSVSEIVLSCFVVFLTTRICCSLVITKVLKYVVAGENTTANGQHIRQNM